MKQNCLISQTAKRVLSGKLLGSALKVCCFERTPACKGVFCQKGVDIFFHLTFFNELVNIFIIIVYIAV